VGPKRVKRATRDSVKDKGGGSTGLGSITVGGSEKGKKKKFQYLD